MSAVLPMVRAANSVHAGNPAGAAKVLVFHKDADAVGFVAELAHQLHASVTPVSSFRDLLDRADERGFGCVLVDYAACRAEVLEQVAAFTHDRPGYPLVVWSGQLEIPLSVEAMKWGALDVLRKPLDNAAIPSVVENALRVGRERQARWNEYRAVVKQLGLLSANEKAVMSLVMQGRTNKEIALEVDCSLRTVEARRHRLLATMQSENAIELAVVLARHGLIDDVINSPTARVAAPHWATA